MGFSAIIYTRRPAHSTHFSGNLDDDLSYIGKKEFRRTDFGSRILAAEDEGEGAVRVRGVSEMKQYPSGSG